MEPKLITGAGEPRAAKVEDRTIGRILIEMGKLHPNDAPRVFKFQRAKGIRFGEAARKLRLVSNADVQYALALQFNFPYSNGAQTRLSPEIAAAHSPFDAQSEAMRDLRTQLLLHWFGGHRHLAIISARPGDGRSYVAANLAVMFAQLGEKTLLVDADLRAPRQHAIFGLANGRGLAHLLNRGPGLEIVDKVPYFENLSVLPAGATPPNPLELLSRSELPAMLAEAGERFSVVIIDTAAGVRGADARIVAARAGGALLVARREHSTVAELLQLQGGAGSYGVQIVGSILNQY
jgi:protein-tyrosine kinase